MSSYQIKKLTYTLRTCNGRVNVPILKAKNERLARND